MTMTITPPESPAAEIERLVQRVAVLERTQRTEDTDGFLALFDADAVWITGGGRRLIGRDAIASFTRAVLPGGMAGGSVRYDIAHIRFITPDVALTSVDQEYLTGDGRPLAPRQQGRPSYLWHRVAGEWRIVSGQNTPVPVDAE
jgi:uncharacterized protein (TIGR02246 family)